MASPHSLSRNAFSIFLAWPAYIFLVAPSLIVIPMSFGDSSELVFPPREWTLDLYRRMLEPQAGWLGSAWTSLQIGLATMVISTALGTLAAYGLTRAKFRGRSGLTILLLSPMFVPTIIIALALYLAFSVIGMGGSLPAVVIGHTLITLPFIITTARASIAQLDEGIELAAEVMGANRLQIFRRVVLPSIRASVLSGALFAFLLSFDEVVISWFVGSPRSPTLPVKMYSSIQWEISPVLAAISTVLVIAAAAVCLIAAFATDKKS
jgi:putative spermidine/putrescine transport system permease protein